MNIHFDDHARFQRATLQAALACCALAAVTAVLGTERVRPADAVLGAAVATLALALAHVRVVVDPVAHALERGAATGDGPSRALLARVMRAHDGIARASRRDRRAAPAPSAGPLLDTAGRATVALANLVRRRQEARASDRGRAANRGRR